MKTKINAVLPVLALFGLTEMLIFVDGVAACIASLISMLATMFLLGHLLTQWDKKH